MKETFIRGMIQDELHQRRKKETRTLEELFAPVVSIRRPRTHLIVDGDDREADDR